MNQPKYIDKSIEIPKALDFKFLRIEGIRRIQELTGSFWTDYNLHDPGVTILEQLCYAITDLAYRTSTDIEEHIFSNEDGQLPFFRPEETLANSPISIEDYRKIFIDSIPEIKNIWFEPVRQFESGFNGLYRILVDISDYGFKRGANTANIVDKVKSLFSKYRNISEDIYEIKILEELPIMVHADIETDGIHDLEKILAKVYFEIEQILAPEVKFYSLNELRAKGISFDKIYNGPKLQHGFILSDDLIPQQTSVVVSDIVRSIMQIEGVVSVKQLSIEADGNMYNSQIVIPDGKIPRIIASDLFSGSSTITNNIKFYKGSLEYSGINQKNFKLFLNELVSENKKAFRISESSIEIPTDKGQINFSEYYSIQNHFPAVYGVGPEGIPGKPDTKRIAQAKQLKGYLLIFEQFMANYLAQLEHFKDLLSIQKKQEQTYFSQTLDNVPGAQELFINKKGWMSDVYLDLQSVPKNYHEGLLMLNKLFDNYTDRRNRFLDYLLAVHGESLSQYALQQFNFYFTDKEFDEFLIRCKTALLQDLGSLNYSRSAGLDYKNNIQNSLSGLEKRLSIFLGFGVNEETDGKIKIVDNSLFYAELKKNKIKLIGDKAYAQFKSNWLKNGDIAKLKLDSFSIDKKFDFIDDKDIEELKYSEEQAKDITTWLLPYKTKIIHKSFLTNGINLLNYKIGKVSKLKKQYILAYNFVEQDKWISFGEFKTKEEVLLAVKVLIDKVKQLNINSEGVRLVEHILLRPDPEMEQYGIYINDETGRHILKSNKQYSLKGREEIINKIEEYFNESKTFFVESDENRDMNIIFEIEELDLKFSSIEPKVSVEETHKEKELLFDYLSGKSDFSGKIGFYIQYGEGKVDIPEEFYSFQISLLFPNWSARFQSHEFRAIANDAILEHKPANIFANVNWLEPDEMDKFNMLFSSWQDIIASDTEVDSEKINVVSDLTEFLYLKMLDSTAEE